MEQHDEFADKLEQEADELKEQSERLGEDIDGTRSGWEAKKDDASVPGAVPAEDGDSDESESDA